MKEKNAETRDALIDDVRERRRRLVNEHDGLQGWVQYLRDCQKEHPEKVIPSRKRVSKIHGPGSQAHHDAARQDG